MMFHLVYRRSLRHSRVQEGEREILMNLILLDLR